MKLAKEFLYDWMGGNEVLLLGINEIRGSGYDRLMKAVSWLSDPHQFPLYMVALAAFALVTWVLKLIGGKRGKWQHVCIWLGIFLVLVGGQYLSVHLAAWLKQFYSYPRPFAISRLSINVLEYVPEEEYFQSFPSEHVMFACLMVVGLWPVLHRWLMAGGVLLIPLVMWARVSVGVHFPADVVGALLISIPMILTLRAVLYKILHRVLRIKC